MTTLQETWTLPEQWSGYSQHSVDRLPLLTRPVGSGGAALPGPRSMSISSPRYLEMVERKFGPDTVQHISKDMSSRELGREHAQTAS